MEINLPQLKAIAHEKLIAEKLISNRLSSDFEEKFKQLCFESNSQDESIMDAKCKDINRQICDIVQAEQSFGSKEIKFEETAPSRFAAIVRVTQPYQQMEDFLAPALWYLNYKTSSLTILDSTPIFNEGIVYRGTEFHSALVVLSLDTKSCIPTSPTIMGFPVTKFDILARSMDCKTEQGCCKK